MALDGFVSVSNQKGHPKCDLGKPHREHTPNGHQLFRSVDWIGWIGIIMGSDIFGIEIFQTMNFSVLNNVFPNILIIFLMFAAFAVQGLPSLFRPDT